MTDNGNKVWDNSGLQWLAVEIVSGRVIAEFADIQCSKLSVKMEEITDSDFNLPFDNAPVNWLEATTPYKIAILLVRDYIVQWGGIIVKRSRDIRAAAINLTVTTYENYLDSVYVTNANYKNLDQVQILGNLANMTANHRFPLFIEATSSTIRRDRSYTSDQDKTILSAMQELSGVINGPEWYTEWRVDPTGLAYHPCLVAADHVGSENTVTTFDSSIMASFNLLEDYSTGYGANAIQANSTAEGDQRPESDWHVSDDITRPVIEYKYSPSTSIINKTVLDQHAASKLLELQTGTTTVSFSAALLDAPRLGVDWHLGDVVEYDISEDSGQFPDFSTGTVRIIGYDIDFQGAWVLTPVLRPVEQAGGQSER